MIEPADLGWLSAVRRGRPPVPFGHREHLRLAWLALETTETPEAAAKVVSESIRLIAEAHHAPQKYNQTVTTAWVLVVDHVRRALDVQSFDELVTAAPWLSDKRLMTHHYSSSTLASQAARHTFVAPDLRPIPADH